MTFVKSSFAQKPHPGVLGVLAAHPWFETIGELPRAALASQCRWLKFSAGQEVFVQGQPCRECLLVGSGKLAGLRFTADGGEKVFGQVGAGAFAAIQSLFVQPQVHWHTLRAITDGDGCLIGDRALRQLCLAAPDVALHIIEQGARLVRHHTDQIDWLTSSTAEQRLAEYILRFADTVEASVVNLPLRWSQIATKLGIRAETVSRLLAKWERQGYVQNGRSQLLVLRLQALREIVNSV